MPDIYLSSGNTNAPLSVSEDADWSAADHAFSNTTREIEIIAGGAACTVVLRFTGDSVDRTVEVPANGSLRRPWRISHIRRRGTTAQASGSPQIIGYW